MEAVRNHGPDTSIDQMANAAGVSKPVLYAEFSDKSGIVDAMAVVLASQVETTVIDRLGRMGESDFAHTISAIAQALIDLMMDEPHLYAYIMRSFRMRDGGILDNALARVVRERATVILGDLAQDLDSDDLDVLTAGVFGFLFGVLESWMGTSRPGQEELVDTVVASVRGGVTAVAAMRSARS